MQSFTSLIATSVLIALVSASPVVRRSDCGVTPTGTISQTPILEPTGVTTAALCMTQCDAQSACLSFVFGMVDNVDNCMLYSVAAASLPAPTSTNLIAYDKSCSSVTTVVPTADNPRGTAPATTAGKATGSQNAPAKTPRQAKGTHANPMNEQPAGNPTSIATPAVNDLSACLADCKGNPACIAYTFTNGMCKLFGPTNARREAAPQQGTHAAPMNAVPAGNPTPIARPVVSSSDKCLEQCKGDSACAAYTFSNNVCKLFA